MNDSKFSFDFLQNKVVLEEGVCLLGTLISNNTALYLLIVTLDTIIIMTCSKLTRTFTCISSFKRR